MKKSLILLSVIFAVSACYSSTSFRGDGSTTSDTQQTDDPRHDPPIDPPIEPGHDPAVDPPIEPGYDLMIDWPYDFAPDYLPDIPADGCAPCPSGWMPVCLGYDYWCISGLAGEGNCCDALKNCQARGGMPGFWQTAGPYDGVIPFDFVGNAHPPAIAITYSGYLADGSYIFNLSCMDAEGRKVSGESHTLTSDECGEASCSSYTGEVCTGDIGCGCWMQYWCYREINY